MTGPKNFWIKRHEPEVWNQTRRLATASVYLTYNLTGNHVIDHRNYMPLIDTGTSVAVGALSEAINVMATPLGDLLKEYRGVDKFSVPSYCHDNIFSLFCEG